jgi:hypothetical protein
VDHVEKEKGDDNTGGKYKTQGNDAKPQASNQGHRMQDGEKKPRSKKLECFIYGDEHYASSCPQRKGGNRNQDKSQEDEDEGFVKAIGEANAFVTRTYQVNAIGFKGFSSTEVL